MSKYTDNDFSHFLKNGRKSQNYTQALLANLLGYSETAISKIENGKQSISIPSFFSYLDALNCKAQLTVATPVISSLSGRITEYNYTSVGSLPCKNNLSELESFNRKLSDHDRKVLLECLTILLRSIDTH